MIANQDCPYVTLWLKGPAPGGVSRTPKAHGIIYSVFPNLERHVLFFTNTLEHSPK